MIVNVPFVHSARVRRERRRQDDDACYLAHVQVEVREVPEGMEAALAPVVLHGTPGTSHACLPPHRSHGGRMYMPHGSTLHGGGANGLGRQGLLAYDGPDYLHPLYASDAPLRTHDAAPLADDAGVVRVVSSTEAAVAGRVREAAGRLLLVGDRVWVETPEPVYDVSRYFSGDVASFSAFSGGRDQYRLDQGGWLEDAERGQGPKGADLVAPPVTVLRPDLLRAPTTDHAIVVAAENLTESMAEHAAEASVDDFAVYAALRDATRAARGLLTEGATPDLTGVVSVLRDALDVLRKAREDDADFQARWVGSALARARNDGIDADPEAVTGMRV